MNAKQKKPVAARKKNAAGYRMPERMKEGETITDNVNKRSWILGPVIGTGGFGAIYSACEVGSKGNKNYTFVVKIEPHENGPLFVEKNFYLRNAQSNDIAEFMKSKKITSLGMPVYYGSGSHVYNGEKYRFIVMERYGKDIWSLFSESGMKFSEVNVFVLALQMIDVLEYIHGRGYVHADLKGANILLGFKKGTESQAYLVDFGLATRINDNEFKPNPKCAHNGTIEYTSRDAHLGVPTMRGDLEILAYNMLIWISGSLPWQKETNPKVVQSLKEAFMSDVKKNIVKHYKSTPDALISFFTYVTTLKPKEIPNYEKCRKILESGLKQSGAKVIKLNFSIKQNNNTSINNDSPVKSRKPPRNKKSVSKDKKATDEESEDEIVPATTRRVSNKLIAEKAETSRGQKRSIATPPVKENYANTATQTSTDKSHRTRTGREVKKIDYSLNDSVDIFEDSPEVKPEKRKKLIAVQDVTVTRKIVKKTTDSGKSWRDCPTVANGRAPPKSKK